MPRCYRSASDDHTQRAGDPGQVAVETAVEGSRGVAEHALHEIHVSAYGHSANNPEGFSRVSSGIKNCELGRISTGDKQLVTALWQDTTNRFYRLFSQCRRQKGRSLPSRDLVVAL